MKNINRDYLIKIDARTAEITSFPKELKFFNTDVKTSNIFFQLINLTNSWDNFPDGASNYIPEEDANNYTLTLRVVRPNNTHRDIEAMQLDQPSFFMADLTEDFIELVGYYECELFVDADINGYTERRTTEPFEYEVKKSVFYNMDEVIDTTVLALEDIATIDYVNGLVTGNISLDGYATDEDLSTKADKEHLHEDYVTQVVFDEAMARIGAANIDLYNFVANNSISLGRKPYSTIGQYSTATGYETTASGKCSHAEGNNTRASSYNAHAEGCQTVAAQDSAHAEGMYTMASGYASHAEGYHTKASANFQHVQGKYNIEDDGIYAHIVGNGPDDEHRSNAHTLDWQGNAWFAGNVAIGENHKQLATEEYVNSKIKNGGGSGPAYDDTELQNSVAALQTNVNELQGNITVLQNHVNDMGNSVLNVQGELNSKANKNIIPHHEDGISVLFLSDLNLDDSSLGNRRYIRVTRPLGSTFIIDLPLEEQGFTNIDFAEVHVFIMPTTQDIALTVRADGHDSHIGLAVQDMPTTLEVDKSYELIFTYINCSIDNTGMRRWLAGAIIYE